MSNFNIGDSKYNNGEPIDTDAISQEEWIQCAKEWSEGDKNLEELIYFCLQNEIKTYASCSGHNVDRPYISFIINEKNRYIIDSIASEFKDIKGAGIVYYSTSHASNARGIDSYTTFYLPTRDTSGFYKIKEICQKILEGHKYEIDKNLTLFRKLAENMKISRFGSYIEYECGTPIDNYLSFFKENPIPIKNGRHIFVATENTKFIKYLQSSSLITNGDEGDLFYVEQTEKNSEQIHNLFTQISKKICIKDYEITNEELAQIARRPKKISIGRFTQRIKEWLQRDKTKEKDKRGESNDRNLL